MAEPTEAQRKRSEARERRRSQAAPAEDHTSDGVTDGADEPLEAVKHAAKVAAAGAAVGAAAAAARALTSRTDGEEHEAEPAGDSEETQSPEQKSPEAESRGQNNEPAAETEETQVAADESPEAEPRPGRDAPHDRREEPVRGASPDEATETVQHARRQLSTLLERPVESVSAFERTHDGWLVTLELVEVSRIPESTDVLASYEVELDDDRNLRRYARVRRYIRSQSDREGQR
jgi:gas vesicle protein GvpO